MGDAVASALLSSTSATGLSTLDALLRTFRAASTRGETVTLHSKDGVTTFKIIQATAGDPAAARQRSKRQPAAAAVPVPARRPPPPAGRRKAPRSRGSLLRDERRRLLKISTDVFDRSGWRGRCPPPTVYRPALLTPAQDSGQVGKQAPRPIAGYREMVGDAPGRLLLKLPPAAPLQPTFGPAPPSTLRLRIRGSGGIAQLDGHTDHRGVKWECNQCNKLYHKFDFNEEKWKGRRVKADDTYKIWCPQCHASR
jgi:hypothetical protein